MPTPQIKNFSKKSGKSVSEVEKLWNKAKELATDMGKKDDFKYITGILKNMLGMEEDIQDQGLKRYKPLFEMVSTNITITPENAGQVIDTHNPVEEVVNDLEEINKKNSIEDNIIK